MYCVVSQAAVVIAENERMAGRRTSVSQRKSTRRRDCFLTHTKKAPCELTVLSHSSCSVLVCV